MISQVDEVVHQRIRLAVLALLSKGDRSFTELRDALGQSDGGLGRHLKVLAGAGYVALTKSFQDNRPRTDVAITGAGSVALASERGALTELIIGHRRRRPVRLPGGRWQALPGQRPRPPDLILGETFSPFYVAEQWPLGPDFLLPGRISRLAELPGPARHLSQPRPARQPPPPLDHGHQGGVDQHHAARIRRRRRAGADHVRPR